MIEIIIGLVLVIVVLIFLDHIENLTYKKRNLNQINHNNRVKKFNAWYLQLMELNNVIKDREMWASSFKDGSTMQMRCIKDRDDVLERQICLLMKNFKLS